MFIQTIGLTLFFSIVFPIAPYLFRLISGGMYGELFRNSPPVVFLTLNLFITYLIPLVLALVFSNMANLKNRITDSNKSEVLFLLALLLIIAPQLLHLYTSTISGGGASFTLMRLSAPFMFLGKVLASIGAIRFFMSLEPNTE